MSFFFRFVFVMWLLFAFQLLFGLQLSFLGIEPRTASGLIGIVTGPFIHGNFLHIVSNTIPLIFLTGTLHFFYKGISVKVFLLCYFFTNIFIWLLGRPLIHIGVSGVVYGVASFLIFFGFFSRDLKSIMISIVIIFLYGGMVYGLLPNQPGVSWESHLIGAIVGAFTAYFIGQGALRPGK